MASASTPSGTSPASCTASATSPTQSPPPPPPHQDPVTPTVSTHHAHLRISNAAINHDTAPAILVRHLRNVVTKQCAASSAVVWCRGWGGCVGGWVGGVGEGPFHWSTHSQRRSNQPSPIGQLRHSPLQSISAPNRTAPRSLPHGGATVNDQHPPLALLLQRRTHQRVGLQASVPAN